MGTMPGGASERITFQRLASHPAMSMEEYKAITPANRQRVPQYVDTYVKLDLFAA